MLYTEVANSRG